MAGNEPFRESPVWFFVFRCLAPDDTGSPLLQSQPFRLHGAGSWRLGRFSTAGMVESSVNSGLFLFRNVENADTIPHLEKRVDVHVCALMAEWRLSKLC